MILDKVAAVLKKDVVTSLRYRNGLLMNLISPLSQLIMFYYLARAVGPQFKPDGMSYFVFLLVGAGFYTFLLTGMHAFLSIIQESQQNGTLEVLMTTATPVPTLLTLGALSAFAGGLVQLLLLVAGGLLIFRPQMHANAAACFIVFGLSLLIAFAIGMIAAGLQISTHKGSAALWAFGSSAWILAGTLFPVSVLPRPVQFLAQLVPLTHSLTGMRLALLERANASALTREVGILMVFSAVLLPASLWFLSWTLRRARQDGTLSFY